MPSNIGTLCIYRNIVIKIVIGDTTKRNKNYSEYSDFFQELTIYERPFPHPPVWKWGEKSVLGKKRDGQAGGV